MPRHAPPPSAAIPEPSAPEIYDYACYRQYLGDWFAARKAENPRFSHRLFARLAGQKSPSLLLHVVRGQRNLTEATTEAFLRALRLGEPEARWFRGLVGLQGDEASRRRARLQLRQHPEARARGRHLFAALDVPPIDRSA